MSTEDSTRQRLSAFADGQDRGAEEATRQWSRDSQARQDWHDWHLIGDVLRSEELASAPGHDEAFLASLRQRLQSEPAVLAPGLAGAGGATGLRRWRTPMTAAAAAAGVAAVAVVVLALQGVTADGPALTALPSAATQAPSAVVPVAQTPPGAAAPAAQASSAQPWPSGTGPVIRDPRLDEALRAQRQGGATPAPAGSGGVDRVSAPK